MAFRKVSVIAVLNHSVLAQFQWRVLGSLGTYFHIGVYHGADSGHLVVHCNSKVLLVDFGVKEPRQYPFFLDDELYELHIVQDGSGYRYNLVHNREVDSPINRKKQAERKYDRWLMKAGVAALVLLVLVGFFVASQMATSDKRLAARLRDGEGVATQIGLTQYGGQWEVSYRADNRLITQPLRDTLHGLRFPLATGDVFAGRYWPSRPKVFCIQWDAPNEPMLRRYATLATREHALRHPNLSAEQVICQVQAAYDCDGAEGLAKMYHQNRNDGGLYNPDAYLRMVRDTAFRSRAADCL